MKLTTKSRYAVMAMVDLALYANGNAVSITSIAERQSLPTLYLEKIFAKLRQAGIIKSVRGSQGGYELARPSKNISIYEIITVVDAPIRVVRCNDHINKVGCQPNGSKCLTHDLWDQLGTIIQSYLKSISLHDVCENKVHTTSLIDVFSTPQKQILAVSA